MSLLASVLVALIAMMRKQWLNHNLLGKGKSMIDHCWDRQRWCVRLEQRFSGPIVFAPPMLLQLGLISLLIGVYSNVVTVNLVFGIILAVVVGLLSVYIMHSNRRMLPVAQAPQAMLSFLHGLWENSNHETHHQASHSRQAPSLSTIRVGSPTVSATPLWLTPTALATLREENTNDAQCVSWVLWNITNPEALDAAIRLVGMIQWFKDGLDVLPTYDLIVSIFGECFNSNGEVYPGMRDRAYNSLQALLWIRICAMCVSQELAERLLFPTAHYKTNSLDSDLMDLIGILRCQDFPNLIASLHHITPGSTPTHLQWTSNALLHLSWTKQGEPAMFDAVGSCRSRGDQSTVPFNAILNRLLASCIFFGNPIEEEVLKVKDKS